MVNKNTDKIVEINEGARQLLDKLGLNSKPEVEVEPEKCIEVVNAIKRELSSAVTRNKANNELRVLRNVRLEAEILLSDIIPNELFPLLGPDTSLVLSINGYLAAPESDEMKCAKIRQFLVNQRSVGDAEWDIHLVNEAVALFHPFWKHWITYQELTYSGVEKYHLYSDGQTLMNQAIVRLNNAAYAIRPASNKDKDLCVQEQVKQIVNRIFAHEVSMAMAPLAYADKPPTLQTLKTQQNQLYKSIIEQAFLLNWGDSVYPDERVELAPILKVRHKLPYSSPKIVDLQHRQHYAHYEELRQPEFALVNASSESNNTAKILEARPHPGFNDDPHAWRYLMHFLHTVCQNERQIQSVLDFICVRIFTDRSTQAKALLHLKGLKNTGKSQLANVMRGVILGVGGELQDPYVTVTGLKEDDVKFETYEKILWCMEDLSTSTASFKVKEANWENIKEKLKSTNKISKRGFKEAHSAKTCDMMCIISSNDHVFVETSESNKIDILTGLHFTTSKHPKLYEAFLDKNPDTGEVVDTISFFTSNLAVRPGYYRVVMDNLWKHFKSMEIADDNDRRIGMATYRDPGYELGLSSVVTQMNTEAFRNIAVYTTFVDLMQKNGFGGIQYPIMFSDFYKVSNQLFKDIMDLPITVVKTFGSTTDIAGKWLLEHAGTAISIDTTRIPDIGWLNSGAPKATASELNPFLLSEELLRLLGLEKNVGQNLNEFAVKIQLVNASINYCESGKRFTTGKAPSGERVRRRFSHYCLPADTGEYSRKYLGDRYPDMLEEVCALVDTLAVETFGAEAKAIAEANRDEWIADNMKLRHAKQTELTDEFLL